MEKPPLCVYWHCGVVIGCTYSTCKRSSEIGSGVKVQMRGQETCITVPVLASFMDKVTSLYIEKVFNF